MQVSVTLDQITRVMPGARAVAAAFVEPLNAAMREFGITTERRVEMFLAQIAVESGQLRSTVECMDYSAERLMQVWPRRFPTLAVASHYAHKPEALANRVYADRGGNRDEASGDGWLHRGAGLIGLTFRDNQKKCADYFGIELRKVGDWLRTPEGACRSAAWFWKTHGCNELADKNDFDGVSDAINIGHQTDAEGDAIGYQDRLAFLNAAERIIA
jgi:putative chitinase